MKLTELDRIYFLFTPVYGNQMRRLVSDTTHLAYILDGEAWFFCSGTKYGTTPQCFIKTKSLLGKCVLNPTKPSETLLEENNSKCDGVTCPECLAIAIKGEIPVPIKV